MGARLDGSSLPDKLLTLVVCHSVATVIVGKEIDLQHFAQEFAPRIYRPQVFGVGVRIQQCDPHLWLRIANLVSREASTTLHPTLPAVTDVKARNPLPPACLQPHNFVFLQLGRGRGLEEEGTDGVPHIDNAALGDEQRMKPLLLRSANKFLSPSNMPGFIRLLQPTTMNY